MDTLVRLQVSELSKGLVAAWVMTLVGSLTGVLALVSLGSHQYQRVHVSEIGGYENKCKKHT